MGFFLPQDVANFIERFVAVKAGSEKLQDVFKTTLDRYRLPAHFFGNDGRLLDDKELSEDQLSEKKQLQEKRQIFRKALRPYVRQYTFLTQIIRYLDIELEKLYLFAKYLLKKLPYEPETLPYEVVEMVDMDKYRQQEKENGSIVLNADEGKLEQTGGDGHGVKETKQDLLSAIVEALNKQYHIDFKQADKVVKSVQENLANNPGLAASFNNPHNQDAIKREKLKESIEQALIANADEFIDFFDKIQSDKAFGHFFMKEMYRWYSENRTLENPRV
jgi:type I restriction enzyme R subunit